MKIFSWVHRRFNNKAENVKKNGNNGSEEEQFPAEDKCDDVFERWRGGILAIGTFGYDPLKDENSENLISAYFSEKNDDDDDDDDDDLEKDEVLYDDNGDDDDEHNHLVFSTYSFNAEDRESMGFTEMEMEESWSHKFGFEYVMMKKKERITLADLFCADSDKDHDTNTNTNTNTNTKKQASSKSDLVKDKSNRKQGAKDARPIHKLNQLMRRMLKRKIHPDVGPTNRKVAGVNSNNSNKFRSSTTDDYASLLPTQDAADHI